jgi:hypothetical protein
MKRPIIPRFEPEQIAAEANARWRGDDEKVSTTSLKYVVFEGVVLSSRYDKAAEYETMLDMIEGVDPDLRGKVKSIFCDSKAGLCYAVELYPCTTGEAKIIGDHLDRESINNSGWHNGIYLTGSAGGNLCLAADFDVDN